MICTTWEPWQR